MRYKKCQYSKLFVGFSPLQLLCNWIGNRTKTPVLFEAHHPIEAINIRMEEMHLKQVDLVKEIG